jgi:hypothetical protein
MESPSSMAKAILQTNRINGDRADECRERHNGLIDSYRDYQKKIIEIQEGE